MIDPKTIKKLVSQANPHFGNIPPDERKPQAQIDDAKNKLKTLISEHPKQVFLAMAENGTPGLDHFSIDQLKAMEPIAVDTFTKALLNPDHRWYRYAKVIYIFAQLDHSSSALDIIMQRLTAEIDDRLAFPYRFYPMVGYALKQFDEQKVADKIIEVFKNTSWFNRYVISMSLRNVCRENPNRYVFNDAFQLLLDMATEADPNSADADNIAKCITHVQLALNGE